MTLIQVLETPYGDLVAHWNDHGLESLHFSDSMDSVVESPTGAFSKKTAVQREREAMLATAAREYFETGEFRFPIDLCDMSRVPPFHKKVLMGCAAIPAGETMTYGGLADAVGSPGAARAVGQAMAKNRWPLLIPCHRVVGHSGRMTGYSGRGGTDTKRRLLEFEAAALRPQAV